MKYLTYIRLDNSIQVNIYIYNSHPQEYKSMLMKLRAGGVAVLFSVMTAYVTKITLTDLYDDL